VARPLSLAKLGQGALLASLIACGEKGTFDPSRAGEPGPAEPSEEEPFIDPGEPGCYETCDAPNGGVELGCGKRFLYGVNYAWNHFAADFGGIASWSQPGVSTIPDEHSQNLADMREHEMHLVRWWIFPDFRGDAVVFDDSGTPIGTGGTLLSDLDKALELAARNDVYLMLTLFSFDGFRPTRSVSGRSVPSLAPLVTDAERRSALLENVVSPVAKVTSSSPYAYRMLAWDVINEPEWALRGDNPYGGARFYPIEELVTVTHAEMEGFLEEVITVLREESGAYVTVGSAGLEWARAWSALDLDFYQVHRYDDRGYDWTSTPLDHGLDRPTMLGEFPLQGFSQVPYAAAVDAWWSYGWAGAMAWQYNASTRAEVDAIREFGSAHSCAVDPGR
jgi:hypothetical protein